LVVVFVLQSVTIIRGVELAYPAPEGLVGTIVALAVNFLGIPGKYQAIFIFVCLIVVP
jgi:hypothetical protein